MLTKQYWSLFLLALLISSFQGEVNAAQGFILPDFKLPGSSTKAPGRSGNRVVTGSATKGPIANASVNAYEVDDNGATVGSPVATTTTDASGGFNLDVPASVNGPLMVITSGGSFIDESDTRPLDQRRRINLGSDEGFRSMLMPGETLIAITPFTDALVDRSLASGRLGGFLEIIEEAISLSTVGFGFSLFNTLPADPSTPAASASSAQLQYALLLGATANIANVASLKMGMPQPTYAVIKAVITDMVDGSTDGLYFGEPINVAGKVFPNIDFDQQLTRFRNNNYAGYAGVPLPEWNNAEEDLALEFPTAFFGVAVDEIPRIWGLKAFVLGHSILHPDGTGTFFNTNGEGQFIWAADGEGLTRDFTSFGSVVTSSSVFYQFNETTGQQDEIHRTIFLDKLFAETIADEGERLKVSVTLDIRVVIENVTQGTTNTFGSPQPPAEVFLYAKANSLIEDDPPSFPEHPALPALTNGQIPFADEEFHTVDQMRFNTDGTGFTTVEDDTFSWQLVENRKGLQVTFDNGEMVTYYVIATDDPEFGDLVAALNTVDGKRFLTGSIVLSNFEDLVWTEERATAIHRGKHSILSENGNRLPYNRSQHYYPDGTGVHEFIIYFDTVTGKHITGRDGFCWGISADGNLDLDFYSGNADRGYIPTPGECASPAPSDSTQWSWELYDEFNGEVKTVNAESFAFDASSSPELFGIYPTILNLEEPFNAVPPIAVDDIIVANTDGPVTVAVLANDITQSSPIDASTVQIVGGPFNLSTFQAASGTASVDTSNGSIIYVPDSTDQSSRRIDLNYQVRDTAGNLSAQGIVAINLDPSNVPVPEPDPTTTEFSGNYVGSYSWDCGDPTTSGSTPMSLVLVQEIGSPIVTGTIDMLSGSAAITGQRLDLPTMGLFGFEGGTPDPDGMYVFLAYPEVEGSFVTNDLSLEITSNGLSGIAKNGDSGPFGCALPTGAVGVVDLFKQAPPTSGQASGFGGRDISGSFGNLQ